jgi:hypothetical protein
MSGLLSQEGWVRFAASSPGKGPDAYYDAPGEALEAFPRQESALAPAMPRRAAQGPRVRLLGLYLLVMPGMWRKVGQTSMVAWRITAAMAPMRW